MNSEHDRRMQAIVGDNVIADSNAVVSVEEDGSPTRCYFAREDVQACTFEASQRTSECPFKASPGTSASQPEASAATHAAWSDEDPYEKHADLKHRIAFYDEQAPQITGGRPDSAAVRDRCVSAG